MAALSGNIQECAKSQACFSCLLGCASFPFLWLKYRKLQEGQRSDASHFGKHARGRKGLEDLMSIDKFDSLDMYKQADIQK